MLEINAPPTKVSVPAVLVMDIPTISPVVEDRLMLGVPASPEAETPVTAATEPSSRFLSSIWMVEEFREVVVPFTVRFPPMVTAPVVVRDVRLAAPDRREASV